MTVWYRIDCMESISFIVDSKVSYSIGDENLVFPRNIDFEIVHKIDNKNLYRGSSDFVGVNISDRSTNECFNPIINFRENGKTNTILIDGKNYTLFKSSDVINYTGLNYLDPKENLSWNMAAEFCESRGLHLLTIGDAEEETFVLSLLSQKSPERSEMIVSVYLGLKSRRQVYSIFCPVVL